MPGGAEDWDGWVTTGKLGLRIRAIDSPLAGASSVDVVLGLVLNTEPLSSSQSESMRDERLPVEDDDELRRDADDRLAMRPNARMAVPVFCNNFSDKTPHGRTTN